MYRRILAIACFAVIFLSFYASADEKVFYYSLGNRIEITKSSTELLVLLKNDNISDFMTAQGFKKEDFQYSVKYANLFKISADPEYVQQMVDKMTNDAEVERVSPVYYSSNKSEFGVTNQICIKFRDGIEKKSKKAIFEKYGAKLVGEYLNDVIEIDNIDNVFDIANSLYESELVEFSHPNFFACIQFHDLYYTYQYNLHNNYHYDKDVHAEGAWQITTGDNDIIIAVIDDGVIHRDYDIPSNKLVILQGSNFGGHPAADPDCPYPMSGDYHGQACAGLIIAQHNDYGIKGIAPGCRIMPVRIDQPSTAQQASNAITFAKNNGADVLSCSWGVPDSLDVVKNSIIDAITYGRNNKGCVVCFSASNSADRHDPNNQFDPGIVSFPASMSLNYDIISIGATDSTDIAAAYTPYQVYKITLTATSSRYLRKPFFSYLHGTIWSTDVPGIDGFNPDPYDSQYYPTYPDYDYPAYTSRFGGTSAACPLVAGTAALILSVNPNLTNAEVMNCICSTTDKVGGYNYSVNGAYGTKCAELGYGRLNAYAAVYAASGSPKIASGMTDVAYKVAEPTLAITPNPANPFTTIRYTLAKPGNVSLDIYSVSGQKVATLVDGAMTAGTHSAVFDGSSLASGIYLYRFRTAGFAKTGKIALVK